MPLIEKLKPITKANLGKLAIHLETLPVGYVHFDMLTYYDRASDLTSEQRADYALNNGGVDKFNCGTVACAVGHGPAAGILFSSTEITRWGFPNWDNYAERFTEGEGNLFEWLFSSRWVDADNSHYGAAARIRFVLNETRYPEEFLDSFADCEVPDRECFDTDKDFQDVVEALKLTYAKYRVDYQGEGVVA